MNAEDVAVADDCKVEIIGTHCSHVSSGFPSTYMESQTRYTLHSYLLFPPRDAKEVPKQISTFRSLCRR